jgi:hypothetical protein
MNMQVNHGFSVRARSGFPRAQEIIGERYYTWSQPKPKRPLIRACCNEAGMQASDEATLMDEVEASCQQCYAISSGKSYHWKHWNLSRGTSAMPHFTGWKYITNHGHGWHGGASGESITSREVIRSEIWAVRQCDLRHLKIAHPNEICMTHCRWWHLEGLWKGLWNYLAQFCNSVVKPRKQLRKQYRRNYAALQGLPKSGCPSCSLSKPVMVEKLPKMVGKGKH